MSVTKLEDANNTVRPGRDEADGDKTQDTWYQTESVKCCWNREHTEANLCLHHQSSSTDQSDLQILLARPTR